MNERRNERLNCPTHATKVSARALHGIDVKRFSVFTARFCVFIARSELRKVLLLVPSVCGLFVCVYEISREPLNGLAPNSHRRRLWSFARTSLKVKVKGQRSKSPGTKNDSFVPFRRPACGLCLVKHV